MSPATAKDDQLGPTARRQSSSGGDASHSVAKLVPQRKDLEEEKKVLEARIAEINQAQNIEESDELAQGMTKKVSEYSEALQDMDK